MTPRPPGRLNRPALIIPVDRLAIDRIPRTRTLEDVVGQTNRDRLAGAVSEYRLGTAFGRFGVAALLMTASLAPLRADAQRSDPLFGPDKIKHFFLSAFVQSVSYSILRATNADHQSSLMGASAATGAVGVWKELRDSRSGGTFSVRDLVWDAAGAGTATVFLAHSRR